MALTCVEQLQKLHDAILSLNTGQRVIGVNFGERSVQYSQSQLADLQKLYSVYWRQCGPESGLINLSPSNMVERGPPARIPR